MNVYKEVYEAARRLRMTAPVDDEFPELIERLDLAIGRADRAEYKGTAPLTFAELNHANETRALEWQNGQPTDATWVEFATIELAGEAGEVADAVKKYLRHFKSMPGGVEPAEAIPAIADELADTVICVDRLAQALGIDLAGAIRGKFNRTSEKHGFITKLAPTPPKEGA